MENISFQYPPSYILLCIALAIAYALLMYFNDKRWESNHMKYRWLMGGLRFFAVLFICILLMGPLLSVLQQEEKPPYIAIVQDGSSSVSSDETTKNILFELEESLQSEYNVDAYHLSHTISEGLTDTLDGQSTNLSQMYEFLEETYANQNLSAIVLASDGIYNEGINPIYKKHNVAAPLFVIPQGDTSVRKDIAIKQIYHNKIAYLDDRFIIQPDISANNCKGSRTRVSIFKNNRNGQPIAVEDISITEQSFFTTLEMDVLADQTGVVKYIVEVQPIGGEYTSRNNTQTIYVDILDSRQKMLLLAEAPHPDISALTVLIEKNKNYEVDYRTDYSNIAIEEYDVLLLHNLPTRRADVSQLVENAIRSQVPILFIIGTQADMQMVNNLQNVIEYEGSGKNINEITATFESNFSLFEPKQEWFDEIKKYPPLRNAFGMYSLVPGANALINQQIGQVGTDYPLLAFNEQSGYRTGVLLGEGIWRWKLENYLVNQNFDITESLVNKTIQYLSTKRDKRQFRASSTQQIYKEYERVGFEAELYNDAFEKITDPDVNLKVINQNGEEFPFSFSRKGNYYQVQAGLLPPGNYTFNATTTYNGELLQANGKFSVQDVQLEMMNITADHGLLQELVNRQGGQLAYNQNTDQIIEMIKNQATLKPVVYQSRQTESVMHLKWPFFLIAGLLLIEWAIRRLLGRY